MRLVGCLSLSFALLVVPALGYLLGATIFIHFYDKIETGDLNKGSHIVVATSCERQGPVTYRGFGYWWKCQAEVTKSGTADTRIMTTRFLKPEHIGHRVPVNTARNGNQLIPEQPYQGLGGVLAMVFGILWLFVWAVVANPVLRRATERMRQRRLEEEALAPPESAVEDAPDRVVVLGGRPRWLRGRKLFVVLVACGVGVFATADAFRGDGYATLVAGLSWTVLLLIIGNGLRRLMFGPRIALSTEGVEWGIRGMKLSWAEVRQVQLSANKVLSIHPHVGAAIRIGWFGDEQANEVEAVMRKYCPMPYTRQVVD